MLAKNHVPSLFDTSFYSYKILFVLLHISRHTYVYVPNNQEL